MFKYMNLWVQVIITGNYKLLKEIVEQISTPLAKLFNLSLEEGIVPSEWKQTLPRYLRRDRGTKENITESLTPVVCKLLETLIRYQSG